MEACIGYPEEDDEYLTKNSAQFHEHLGYRMVGEFKNVDTSSSAGTIWCGWRRSLEFMKKFKRFQRNLMRTC